jgi:hypothetical protein
MVRERTKNNKNLCKADCLVKLFIPLFSIFIFMITVKRRAGGLFGWFYSGFGMTRQANFYKSGILEALCT